MARFPAAIVFDRGRLRQPVRLGTVSAVDWNGYMEGAGMHVNFATFEDRT